MMQEDPLDRVDGCLRASQIQMVDFPIELDGLQFLATVVAVEAAMVV